MLAGHFGLAAIVKSREPQLPLWSLMLASQFMDVIFLVLYGLKIEGFNPVPGTNGGYGQLIISADYTHSLVGALVLSVLAGILAMVAWGRRNGLIIGALVFSHWILDLIVHRGDMPILPGDAGNLPRLGLGLWSIPWLSAFIELVIVLVGAYLYYHAAMRTAVKAERQDAKAGATVATPAASGGLRRQALITSVVLFLSLVLTLSLDVFVG